MSETNLQRKIHRFICYLTYDELFDIFNELTIDGAQGWFVFHDKETEDKKDHFHCFLKFPKKTSVNKIGRLFNISPNLVKACDSPAGYLNYCTHVANPSKKQYKLSDFKFFNFSYTMALDLLTDDNATHKIFYELFEYISVNKITDYRAVVDYCLNNGLYKILKQHHFIIKEILYHNKNDKYIMMYNNSSNYEFEEDY